MTINSPVADSLFGSHVRLDPMEIDDADGLFTVAAIEKLRAKREGTLRRHMRRPDASARDTAVYSIVDEDWPDVKQRLLERFALG